MNQYLLTIVFTNGDQKEVMLSTPHELQPDGRNPFALSYKDRDGILHNLPWNGIREFYFSPEDYMKVRQDQRPIAAVKGV